MISKDYIVPECNDKFSSHIKDVNDSEDLVGKFINIGPGYVFEKFISSGTYGYVYSAKNILDGSDKVAIKLEYYSVYHQPTLKAEVLFYKRASTSPYIPQYFYYRTYTKYCSLVLELLGPNLQEIFEKNSKKFSIKTELLIVQQCIYAIKFVHEIKYVHRDIKPSNFLIKFNSDGSQSICLADFGISKQYIDNKTKKHLPYAKNNIRSGTPIYMSKNAHRGIQFSRQDDLESLAYMMIRFVVGHLPWRTTKATDRKILHKNILKKKERIDFTIYLERYSPEWAIFINYINILEFGQDPDYKYCYDLFYSLYKRLYFTDYDFDWMLCNTKDHVGEKFVDPLSY